jgi:hypothetical protein
MGYDMYWREIPPEMKAVAEIARAEALRVAKMIDAQRKAIGSTWNPDWAFADTSGYQPTAEEQELWARREAAWDAYRKAEPYYFRLNIFGMSRCLDIMAEAGMVVDSQSPKPWPELETYGLSYADYEAEVYDVDYNRRPPTSPAVIAYQDVRDAHLRDRGGAERPGMPIHKFGSNNGWIVTPDEIRAALRVAPEGATYKDEQTGEVKPLPWWIRWCEFLRGGVQHGGIEVH